MKKLLFLSMALFFLLSTACKKEETTIPLSKFIIGDWTTGVISDLVPNEDVRLDITFNSNGTYDCDVYFKLTKKNGYVPEYWYTTDNNTNTLEMSDYILYSLLGLTLSGDPIMFNVEFSSDNENTMKLKSTIQSIGIPDIILTKTKFISSK